MERRDEDWVNPPEEKDDYEPDVDSINDQKWLDEHDDKCYSKGDCK